MRSPGEGQKAWRIELGDGADRGEPHLGELREADLRALSKLALDRVGEPGRKLAASVTARQTRSIGWGSGARSGRRRRPRSRSACVAFGGSHLILLVQVSFKGVETVCPEAAIGLEPLRGLGSRSGRTP